ncbi:hypothetical protein N1495_00430 [Streptococcus didelphis]|uniref:Uncharacterized protein n=1 Tax=Streptococcus didelphis TaxID=102886 RepID=A0ABY9LGE8_9STRE|nr:hypothetical protein [Streptococcus didelphis]WMB27961.1 hypothetical protein N1496_08130 [Streptococcus didelphis]WMB29571.1 hypothetical protein N1495_00430 [Streptococcus didelphis]
MIIVVIPIMLFIIKLHPEEVGLIKDSNTKVTVSSTTTPKNKKATLKMPFAQLKNKVSSMPY